MMLRNCDITALTLALALAAGTAAQPGTTKMPGQGECGGKGGCQERTSPCSSHDQCSGDFFCDFDEGQCRNCCFSATRVEGKCQMPTDAARYGVCTSPNGGRPADCCEFLEEGYRQLTIVAVVLALGVAACCGSVCFCVYLKRKKDGASPGQVTGQEMVKQAQSKTSQDGWSECIDPESGKTYYQNHITHATQWERPY